MKKKEIKNTEVTVEEMTTAEVLKTVDAGDYEPAEENEIDKYAFNIAEENDAEDELVDPPVEIITKTEKEIAEEKKSKKAAEDKSRWLKNAKIDENGNYTIIIDNNYKNLENNPGWHPTYYIVTKDLKKIRIGMNLAKELIALGKTTQTTKEKVAEIKKEHKAAKKIAKTNDK